MNCLPSKGAKMRPRTCEPKSKREIQMQNRIWRSSASRKVGQGQGDAIKRRPGHNRLTDLYGIIDCGQKSGMYGRGCNLTAPLMGDTTTCVYKNGALSYVLSNNG